MKLRITNSANQTIISSSYFTAICTGGFVSIEYYHSVISRDFHTDMIHQKTAKFLQNFSQRLFFDGFDIKCKNGKLILQKTAYNGVELPSGEYEMDVRAVVVNKNLRMKKNSVYGNKYLYIHPREIFTGLFVLNPVSKDFSFETFVDNVGKMENTTKPHQLTIDELPAHDNAIPVTKDLKSKTLFESMCEAIDTAGDEYMVTPTYKEVQFINFNGVEALLVSVENDIIMLKTVRQLEDFFGVFKKVEIESLIESTK